MAIELNGISNNLNPRVRGGDQGSAKDSATASTPAEAPATAEDRVQLSSHAQSLFKAESDEALDTNKVAALRQQIEEGSYTIDYKQLAQKLTNLESKL